MAVSPPKEGTRYGSDFMRFVWWLREGHMLAVWRVGSGGLSAGAPDRTIVFKVRWQRAYAARYVWRPRSDLALQDLTRIGPTPGPCAWRWETEEDNGQR